jgi:hypothetical protein
MALKRDFSDTVETKEIDEINKRRKTTNEEFVTISNYETTPSYGWIEKEWYDEKM